MDQVMIALIILFYNFILLPLLNIINKINQLLTICSIKGGTLNKIIDSQYQCCQFALKPLLYSNSRKL